jgi:hypothetical protein
VVDFSTLESAQATRYKVVKQVFATCSSVM